MLGYPFYRWALKLASRSMDQESCRQRVLVPECIFSYAGPLHQSSPYASSFLIIFHLMQFTFFFLAVAIDSVRR